ncbi:energy transducer TonB [Hymenobacter lucidus]|uniref:Energy transducer TonB n=1 Tax=Hymenobacter lucidus TaxID=2880930 RepID=A0ABS8APJ8_9BACT|nr:energy transducer TonB [Hymenobacter lucidus]MCB2408130.1 energy transducer TonB [Hymenobacter lucidus]
MRPLLLVLFSFLLATAPTAAQSQLAAALSDSGSSVPTGSAPAAAPLVYHTAEEMPGFPGGDAAFAKFLRAKINYPAAALNHGASGKVHVSFVVDEQGHILDPKVVKGLGYGLDEEALRLVRIMPWWNPGRIGGQPVKVAYTLPIVFRALE